MYVDFIISISFVCTIPIMKSYVIASSTFESNITSFNSHAAVYNTGHADQYCAFDVLQQIRVQIVKPISFPENGNFLKWLSQYRENYGVNN